MHRVRPIHLKLVYLGVFLLLCVGFASARGQRSSTRSAVIEPQSMVVQSIYQQDVDNFSDDSRAMSPRSWGQQFVSEPSAPEISFDNAGRPETRLNRTPTKRGPFRQVESERYVEPPDFFESQPLRIKQSEDPGQHESTSRDPR